MSAFRFRKAILGRPPYVPPLLALGAPIATGRVGEEYAFQPIIIGGVPTYPGSTTGYHVELDGVPPPGLDFNEDTGRLEGTLSAEGEYDSLTWIVTDGAGHTFSLGPYTITVDEADPEGSVTSISQFGITLNFGEPHLVGQYANGDYWVLAGPTNPLTITSTSPESQQYNGVYTPTPAVPKVASYEGRWINGLMVDPGAAAVALADGQPDNTVGSRQGLDSLNQADGVQTLTMRAYNHALNLDPGATGAPLVLEEGTIIKSRSRLVLSNDPLWLLLDTVVVTVVTEIPADDALRPAPAIPDKSRFDVTVDDLDLTILPSLAPPAGVTIPSLDAVKARLRRYHNYQVTDNLQSRSLTAENNQPDYGADIGYAYIDGLLSLCLNYTTEQKRDLALYLVQLGLDIAGRVEAGGTFLPSGGGNAHAKAVVVFASQALRNHAMGDYLAGWAARNGEIWGEDSQSLYVPNVFVDIIPLYDPDRQRDPYTRAMIGQAEWKESGNLLRIASNWGTAFYRYITGSQLFGFSLAMRLIEGCQTAWNYPAYFDYADRYGMMQRLNYQASSNPIPLFHSKFWEAYRYTDAAGSSTWVGAGAHASEVWLEASRLLDFHGLPATSTVAVTVGGVARTVSSLFIYGKRLVARLASPVTKDQVVTIAFTQGLTVLKDVRLVNLPNAGATTAVNTTGQLRAPATSIQVIRNWDGAAPQKGRLATITPANQDTNVCKYQFIVRCRPRVTPTSGAVMMGNGNGSTRLYWDPNRLRGQLHSTSVCTFIPSASTLFTSMLTYAFEADFTKPLADDGRLYARGGVLQALNAGAWDTTGPGGPGTRTFNHNSQVFSSGFGIFGRSDGTGVLADAELEFAIVHWARAGDPWVSIAEPGFLSALENPGGNGEAAYGFAPKVFVAGTLSEYLDPAGMENRGGGGFFPFFKQPGGELSLAS